MPSFNFVRQRFNWDCSLASISMLTGIDYNIVLVSFFNLYPHTQYDGLTDAQESRVLRFLGVKPKFLSQGKMGVEGLISLPSLNNENGMHCCYFDGFGIHDPNKGNVGKNYYSYEKICPKMLKGSKILALSADF